MRKSLGLLLIFSVALMMVTGCAKKGPDLVGKWKAKMPVPADQKNNPMAGMMSDVTLEFKPDKTFMMTMMFPLEGTYTVVENKVNLTMTKVMGMSVDEMKKKDPKSAQGVQDLPMEISEDGKTLTMSDPSAKSGEKMTFTKEAAA